MQREFWCPRNLGTGRLHSAMKRKWAVGSFVPCSPRHHHCSPSHAAMVRGYREERERQETQAEPYLCNGEGELKRWKENGNTLITFKTWLKAHKKTPTASGTVGVFKRNYAGGSSTGGSAGGSSTTGGSSGGSTGGCSGTSAASAASSAACAVSASAWAWAAS